MRKNTNLHAAEALEDAADVAIYDERKAQLKIEKTLPADVTMDILQGRLTLAELAQINIRHSE
ncbi:hypothetical protein EOD10_02265 [Mesorhizobium sp. M7A.T.Ca.TU.009.01.3.2]|uniref:hypothetical protein n=1 Tax=Mesorhizobium sp. M7A.F.Ca.MR.362.00.0.0 TaxID=2496779 RepID=UPI000FD5AFA8|nr:hypothetical protein [Mesorhizobium sp. M7A.F.Ca.MR.362.00.0.0]RUU24268.1 hypothetical protein EOD10_02265 [Mesorhizobium sp. M7A.T.Ca.TU.009.01.3.2]RUV08585.1 hypothetical protein EOD00_18360 [Mesorhizobium sp. M7A.T.Ca.TU.009.01.3.1]RWN92401.1 MAG: hypothetical protein EOS05_22215 [Mesorhizobium sp.]RUU73952.1 hypothetical protein EOC06_34915 [Mesorhizobium sp. M7A.F.Ca.MR.362.00.0.0]TJV25956.1 MAG: hypothetical protein E5Y04_00465 [Mesorhizobium sp.]